MIKLRNTLISEDKNRRRIIRGEIEQNSIEALTWDWYQRGQVAAAALNRLKRGWLDGSEFPDVILGVRGHEISGLSNSNASSLILHDPCYIVDGFQRFSAAIAVLEDNPETVIHMGIKAFLDTDVDFERAMFRKMNTQHTSVAACVILRNEKEDSRVAGTLYGLSVTEKDFALYNRITWNQMADKSAGGELMRGNVLLRVLATLHRHITMHGPGLMNGVLTLLEVVDRRIDEIGLHQARLNLITFFDAVDEIWGIRRSPIKFGAVYLLDSWIQIFARVLSDHREFWQGKELSLAADQIRDFRKINPNDQQLVQLARGAHQQHDLLYRYFLDIINKGKSSNRYVDRYTLDKAEAAAERAHYTGEHTHL